jgi:hypothetical protein
LLTNVHRYKILLDGDDILASPLGPLVQAVYDQLKLSTDSIYPLTGLPVLGLPSLIPVPSIERIYIHFADPIDTANYNCSLRNQQEVRVFRMTKSNPLCNFVDSLDSKL